PQRRGVPFVVNGRRWVVGWDGLDAIGLRGTAVNTSVCAACAPSLARPLPRRPLTARPQRRGVPCVVNGRRGWWGGLGAIGLRGTAVNTSVCAAGAPSLARTLPRRPKAPSP